MWATASLHLTAAARSQIIGMMVDITDFEPIAYVGWVQDQISSVGERAKHFGPGWGVGFYSSSQVPGDFVTRIDGIPFIFEAATADRLNGAILDFSNGAFAVHEKSNS